MGREIKRPANTRMEISPCRDLCLLSRNTRFAADECTFKDIEYTHVLSYEVCNFMYGQIKHTLSAVVTYVILNGVSAVI